MSSHHPAFPIIDQDPQGDRVAFLGLTKREWFAGLILQGMLSSAKLSVSECAFLVEQAIATADALIAELGKK